ncbi:MAG: hypothetical protein ACLTZT_17820 [Butyricimonas faecalis]
MWKKICNLHGKYGFLFSLSSCRRIKIVFMDKHEMFMRKALRKPARQKKRESGWSGSRL